MELIGVVLFLFVQLLALELPSPSGGMLATIKTTTRFKYENFTTVLASIDWRERGVVTPVKNQKSCGSCWTFSAVAAIEGALQIASGKLVSLSEQELLDCVTHGNYGCHGDFVADALEYVIRSGGLSTEAAYPYKEKNETCHINKEMSSRVEFSIQSYEMVPTNSEEALLKAVANQPVSVVIDSGGNFEFYSSGIFRGECGTNLNHAVTIVGYGSDNDGTKYWIVKNSWGSRWGEGGYIRMVRDVDADEGICGIAMMASFPNINHINGLNISGNAPSPISICKYYVMFVFLFFLVIM